MNRIEMMVVMVVYALLLTKPNPLLQVRTSAKRLVGFRRQDQNACGAVLAFGVESLDFMAEVGQ